MRMNDSQSQRLKRHGVGRVHWTTALAFIVTVALIIGLLGSLLKSANDMQKEYSWQNYYNEPDMIPPEVSQPPKGFHLK